MSNPHLLLWLEAPLQSWGHDSRFSRRDSLDFPTKSGVLGLICCARGASGDQWEWLSAWAGLDMRVHGYVRLDARGKPLARLPLLHDFHMVGAGYDEDDPWEKMLIPKKADGTKTQTDTIITHRYYLQDMAYAVSVEAPGREAADAVAAALRDPVWDLYLGRKACVPTDLIERGVFDSAEAALAAGDAIAEAGRRACFMTVRQGDGGLGEYKDPMEEPLVINDVPLQFGPYKRYRARRVFVRKMI